MRKYERSDSDRVNLPLNPYGTPFCADILHILDILDKPRNVGERHRRRAMGENQPVYKEIMGGFCSLFTVIPALKPPLSAQNPPQTRLKPVGKPLRVYIPGYSWL